MADEIIKLIEYITNNGTFQGMLIAYGVISLLVIAGVITVTVITLKSILKIKNKKRR